MLKHDKVLLVKKFTKKMEEEYENRELVERSQTSSTLSNNESSE